MQKEKINFLKRKIYGEYCAGATQNYLSYKYQWDKADIKYLIQLVKMHGIEILDDKPVRYPLELKQGAVEWVLVNNESRYKCQYKFVLFVKNKNVQFFN